MIKARHNKKFKPKLGWAFNATRLTGAFIIRLFNENKKEVAGFKVKDDPRNWEVEEL